MIFEVKFFLMCVLGFFAGYGLASCYQDVLEFFR